MVDEEQEFQTEDWQAEIDDMLHRMRRLGWFGLALMIVAAGISAKAGFWVNAVTFSMTCGYIGFSLGLMTVTIHKRFG